MTTGRQAAWEGGMSSCNQVALMDSHSSSRFSLQLGEGNRPSFLDIGFCDPRIPLNLSGSAAADWMGDQADPTTGRPYAWIYRQDGGFRAANALHARGVDYGHAITASNRNVTVVRHSSRQLEFLLDGVTQGLIDLSAAQALPPDAVGCVGMCDTSKRGGQPAGPTRAHGLAAIAGPCCRRKPAH